MLVPLRRLLRRTPPIVDEIHRRLGSEATTAADEQLDAVRIRDLKRALAAATGEVTSCGRCAVGKPLPRGAYHGGDCCSGDTAGLFTEDEVAALAQAGTRPRDLVPTARNDVGCAFRGPTSCTLAAEHRPTPCARYACDGLRRELHDRGRLDATEALAAELHTVFARFVAARTARRDREWIEHGIQ